LVVCRSLAAEREGFEIGARLIERDVRRERAGAAAFVEAEAAIALRLS
jgi:hypothetical protein